MFFIIIIFIIIIVIDCFLLLLFLKVWEIVNSLPINQKHQEELKELKDPINWNLLFNSDGSIYSLLYNLQIIANDLMIIQENPKPVNKFIIYFNFILISNS